MHSLTLSTLESPTAAIADDAARFYLCNLCSKNWTNDALFKLHNPKQQCALSDSKLAPVWIHPPAFTSHHKPVMSLSACVGVCDRIMTQR